MSYTGDAVRAKLSALNETQEAIVTVDQWIMFHRYADTDAAFPTRDALFLYIPEVGRLTRLRVQEAFQGDSASLGPTAQGLSSTQTPQSHLSCQWYVMFFISIVQS